VNKLCFYKEIKLIPFQIGEVSQEWKVIQFKDILINKKNGIIKGKKTIKGYGEKYPYLTVEYLRTGNVKEKSILVDKRLLVNQKDLLLLWDGSNAGEFFKGKTGILSSTMIKFVFDEKKNIDFDFIFYCAKKFVQPILKNSTKGTGIPHVDKNILLNSLIPLPPLAEQKAIVQVLKDIDDLIEIVENQIKTLQRIKRALMEKYFSEGVFEHKEFRKTKIGRIPKEWEVNKLGNVAKIIMGQSPPSTTYNTQGIGMPFLQGKAEFGNVHPSETKYTTKPLKIAKIGSVLISVRAPVGDVNIADKEYCIGRGLASIKVLKVDNFFLFYFLHKERTKLQQCSCGSTFQAIKKEHLENFLIPLPPIEEQKEIAHRLKEIDEVIENRKKEKEHLIRIKKKMMDLLLTGKVRIMEC